MVFPASGLPDECRIVQHVEDGLDAVGNMQFSPVVVLQRPCRLYRYSATGRDFGRQAAVTEAMLTFKYKDGDAIDESMQVEVAPRGRLAAEPERYEITSARLMTMWKRPSHWELAVERVATP